ncbi:starvation-inducible DNA-binding protein [Chitinophaga jiangningensis]|uniref:Starvation-inducible DNA-binding protein n=1 Tax=Chitinophaga jiangningensis TaxID=1419482 RepID=A0A1M7ENQ7_9BACT|nr:MULTISPECIES: DNA starvation/stationary phase protection protein [Chitinophaga]MBV7528740.1 DNA starvation/stationary phase protection protein [Chitinophaga sp. sic0106]SHL93431.1 starvation-inducible DNA-binding protein [Chitinophaga jiangningensis]
MKVNTGILPEHAKEVALELNKALADELVLYAKTRNSHWNIEGPSFRDLHLFFEDQYEALEEFGDEVAERIRALGHYALGRYADVLKLTHLLESEYSNDAKTQVKELLDDHETIIRNLRRLIDEFDQKYNDKGTSDFVTGLMEKHEKQAWMLRSFLK